MRVHNLGTQYSFNLFIIMVKLLFSLLFGILFSAITLSNAQDQTTYSPLDQSYTQNVGYTNSHEINNLLSYRLPKWGYTTFSMVGNANAQINRNDYSYEKRDSFVGNVEPNFFKYSESEMEIKSLKLQAILMRNSDQIKQKYANETKSIFQSNSLIADYNLLKYKSETSNSFVINSYSGLFQTTYRSNTTLGSNSNVYGLNEYEYNIFLGIGFGVGRIRNVTPIMLAARFTERSSAMGKNLDSSSEDFQTLAQHFAKLNSYSNTGFRNEKFFWQDLFNLNGVSRYPYSPFEINYLQETVLETFGNRYEGQRSYVLPLITAIGHGYFDRDNSFSDNYAIGIRVVHEIFKNISLESQYSHKFNLETEYNTLIGLINVNYTFGYVQQLADRYLWETSVSTYLGSYDFDFFFRQGNVNSSFSLFVEKSTLLSLQATISFTQGSYKFFNFDNDVKILSNFGISFKHFFGNRFW